MLAVLALPAPAAGEEIQCVGETCLGTCSAPGTIGVSINDQCSTSIAGGTWDPDLCIHSRCVDTCQDGWATSVAYDGQCTELMCEPAFMVHVTGECEGPRACDGGVSLYNSECIGVRLCDDEGVGIFLPKQGCIYVPETCEANTPCILIEEPILTPVSYASRVEDGAVIGRLGTVTIELVTGQFTVVPAIAIGASTPLCSAYTGVPGIRACNVNPLVPERPVYEPSIVDSQIFCLEESFVRVDVNGDGTYDFGSPVYGIRADC